MNALEYSWRVVLLSLDIWEDEPWYTYGCAIKEKLRIRLSPQKHRDVSGIKEQLLQESTVILFAID